MSLDHINESLGKRLNQRSLAVTATAAFVCHVASEVSNGRFKVVSFKNGTLTLAASSSAAAQDLKFQQAELLEQINHKLNHTYITTVRVIRQTN